MFPHTVKSNLPLLIFVLILTACDYATSTSDKKILDFEYFTITVPKNWNKIKAKGQDSYVGRILIDGLDTLEFDLGWYSNDLSEFKKIKKENGRVYYGNVADTSNSLKLLDSIEMEKAKKCISTWQKIDGHLTKFVTPLISGVGMTGIYIDSLWMAGSDHDRFNLFGTNLKPENEQAFLSAIKTLKFTKNK